MYDPSTVAHEIRYPWRAYRNPRNDFERKYRRSFITIWHVDPEDRRGMIVRRGDDTCGWHTPPYPPEARDRIRKLGESQYSTIFAKQCRTAEGKDYARVCYQPSTYDAIYWTWRAIKHQETKRGVWQYDPSPTRAEIDHIYQLDANPVDNLRMSVAGVKDAETCADFFITVYSCYLRFHRPWWRHPRWHFWHWEFQVHPWQTFRRWAFTRCAGCGKRFAWGASPISHSWDSQPTSWFGSEVGLYHEDCSSHRVKLDREPAAGSA